jgi:tetratricopeptide (TPR) repeat protein
MSRKTLTIILASAFAVLILIAYALIMRDVMSQRAAQADLGEQIALAQAGATARQQGANVIETRQAELSTAQAKLAQAHLSFPSEVDSTEVLAHVITTAALNHVNLREIRARTPTTTTLGSSVYMIFAYDVRAEGVLEDVSKFIDNVESGPVGTLNVDQIKIEALPTPVATATLLPTVDLAPLPTPTVDPPIYSTSLMVMVYVRQADAGTTPVPPQTPTSPEARIDQLKPLLEQAQQEGDWERAISLLLAMRQIGATDPTLDDQLVQAYLKEGERRLIAAQYDLAGANYRAALDLFPDNVEAQAGRRNMPLHKPTPTPTVTRTRMPTPTGTPTPTPTAMPTPMPYYVLNLNFGPNTRYPSMGCRWFGFYGHVVAANNYPLIGITVRVWADGWKGVSTTTGGSGEYEVFLDNHPKQEQWKVQVFEAGADASPVIQVESRADCGATQIQMDWRRGY